MKKNLLIPIIFIMCSLSLHGQNLTESKHRPKKNITDRLALKVEYFGELVLHPGISLGTDYTVLKRKWITVHWDADLGGYWHRWNNTSAFVKTTIGSRFSIGSVFADFNLGCGYMHSWAAGPIYQKVSDGSVERATNWGHSHFMPTGSLLFGWDGNKKNNLPWTIYLGPEIYLQSSFNHIFLPHVATKLGFTYKINHQ